MRSVFASVLALLALAALVVAVVTFFNRHKQKDATLAIGGLAFIAVVLLVVAGLVAPPDSTSGDTKRRAASSPPKPAKAKTPAAHREPAAVSAAGLARTPSASGSTEGTPAVRQRAQTTPAPERKVTERDKRLVAKQAFFAALDNLAVDLDAAISQAIDGTAGAATRLRTLKTKIVNRNYTYVINGGDPLIGANLLQSVVSDAVVAARQGRIRALVKARTDLVAARAKLAAEVVG